MLHAFLWRLWVVRYSAWHTVVIQQNIGCPPPPLLQIICWVIFTLIKAESPARTLFSTSEMFSILNTFYVDDLLGMPLVVVLPSETSLSLMETTRQVYPLLITMLLLVYFSVQISNPSAKFTTRMSHTTSLSDMWSCIKPQGCCLLFFWNEVPMKFTFSSWGFISNSSPRNWS